MKYNTGDWLVRAQGRAIQLGHGKLKPTGQINFAWKPPTRLVDGR